MPDREFPVVICLTKSEATAIVNAFIHLRRLHADLYTHEMQSAKEKILSNEEPALPPRTNARIV